MRIDSFSLRTSSALQVCRVVVKGLRLRVRAWAGNNATRCASGAARGLGGHLGPASLVERNGRYHVNETAARCRQLFPELKVPLQPVFDRRIGSWVVKD